MASPSESKVDDNEVTSEPQTNDTHELDLGFPLARQSSIYSLTLDEIQNTVCEPGKSFGSMNMDEFLNNIWSVEEGFAANNCSNVPADSAAPSNEPNVAGPPLNRQGSLSLPAPLCRKTVDEVWAEIHPANHGGGGNGGNTHRQQTFGEMTLEDFLIKAGVVREGLGPPAAPPMHQNYGLPTSFPVGTGVGHIVDPAGYGNGGGMRRVRVGSPVSPVSSDGLGVGQVDDSGYGGGAGIEGNGTVRVNGRKRVGDGGVEKVVERRQRRMIKNRESAARSRARKQAHTVELEAELNLLKEENARLREEERRAQALRKQMIVECMAEHARANAEKAARSLRRCSSGQW